MQTLTPWFQTYTETADHNFHRVRKIECSNKYLWCWLWMLKKKPQNERNKKKRRSPICNLFGEHMVDWPRQKSYVALLFLYYNGHSFKSMNCEMRAGNHCSARVRLKSNYRIDWWFQQGCRPPPPCRLAKIIDFWSSNFVTFQKLFFDHIYILHILTYIVANDFLFSFYFICRHSLLGVTAIWERLAQPSTTSRTIFAMDSNSCFCLKSFPARHCQNPTAAKCVSTR